VPSAEAEVRAADLRDGDPSAARDGDAVPGVDGLGTAVADAGKAADAGEAGVVADAGIVADVWGAGDVGGAAEDVAEQPPRTATATAIAVIVSRAPSLPRIASAPTPPERTSCCHDAATARQVASADRPVPTNRPGRSPYEGVT
jgi:hypothetical protein